MNTNALLMSSPSVSSAGRVRLKADVLKAHRHQRGLTQEALALACFDRKLCVSIASVKRAETGKPLLMRTARHLAAFYALDLSSLLLPDELASGKSDLAKLGRASASGAAPSSLQYSESRFVHVLCVWPVPDREQPGLQLAWMADGAALMPAPMAGAMLAVFGTTRAERGDLLRCRNAAWACRDRLVLVTGGVLEGNTLTWPHSLMQDWLLRQSPGVYVHRAMLATWCDRHHIEPTVHADIGRVVGTRDAGHRPFKLAGRQLEMRVFGGLLDAVLADQQSQFLLLQGMSGMGKSRLLAEMMNTARQHFMYAAQIDVQDAGTDRHRGVIAKLLVDLLELHEVTPFWDQLVGNRLQPFMLSATQMLVCKDWLAMQLTPDERQMLHAMEDAARMLHTVQLLCRIIERMAMQRPMLLLIDDVHAASSSLVGILASVIASTQESQVLWVMAGRAEWPERVGELLRLIPDVAVTTLSLAPLTSPEMHDLARSFSQVGDDWRAQCMQRAQGHPLYLTQLLMGDQGEGMSGSFHYLLQMRMDELTPQDRHVLRLMAVLGKACRLADIRALMGDNQYELDALFQHGLLKLLSGERCDFGHALVRQGIYGSLPQHQRQSMHAQVARSFEGRDHVLHARHLHLACDADAPAALLAAARARQDACDHEAALSLLQGYAEIDYAPQDVHAHAMALGHVLNRMGRMAQARQAYERACQHAPDGGSNLQAKVALAHVLGMQEDLAAQEALIEEALLQAKAEADLNELAALHGLKGHLHVLRGEAARSRTQHSKAMDLASLLGDARLQAQALSGLGDAYYAEGLMVEANEHVARCLRLCEAHGLRDIEVANRAMLATTQIYFCQADSALAHVEAAVALARQMGHRRAEAVSRLTASWVHLGQGKAHAALSHIDEGLMASRTMGATRFEPWLHEARARALFASGDEVGAQRAIEAALDGVERLNLHAFIGPWVMGTWALLHHEDEQAMHMLQRAQAQIEQGCVAHNAIRFYACAMEIHTLAGRHEVAAEVGQAWLRHTRHDPTPWVQGLHDFMLACANRQTPLTPDHPAWVALRERHILHVLLRLPRALLASSTPVCGTSADEVA